MLPTSSSPSRIALVSELPLLSSLVRLRGVLPAVRLASRKGKEGLTARENQLLDLLVEECGTNAQIGLAMGISVETVKRHLTNICDKTGMGTRLELAMRTIQSRMDLAIAEGVEKKLESYRTRISALELELAQSAFVNSMSSRCALQQARIVA